MKKIKMISDRQRLSGKTGEMGRVRKTFRAVKPFCRTPQCQTYVMTHLLIPVSKQHQA